MSFAGSLLPKVARKQQRRLQTRMMYGILKEDGIDLVAPTNRILLMSLALQIRKSGWQVLILLWQLLLQHGMVRQQPRERLHHQYL